MLLFDGLAWPAARAVRDDARIRFAELDIDAPGSVLLKTNGRGRVWHAAKPSAIWRDLSEVDPANPNSVATFVRRRGDPLARLSPTTPATTVDWFPLVARLRVIASAWEPEDAEGISRLALAPLPRATDGRMALSSAADHSAADRYLNAVAFSRSMTRAVTRELFADLHPKAGCPELIFRASSFRAFLCASSANALWRQVEMRRCFHCRSWFELLRRDAKFCSAGCKAASHNILQRKVDYGFGAPPAAPSGQQTGDVADPVARGRPRRPPRSEDA